jgi:hypothetical protein
MKEKTKIACEVEPFNSREAPYARQYLADSVMQRAADGWTLRGTAAGEYEGETLLIFTKRGGEGR